jgi:hypothetical protein
MEEVTKTQKYENVKPKREEKRRISTDVNASCFRNLSLVLFVLSPFRVFVIQIQADASF